MRRLNLSWLMGKKDYGQTVISKAYLKPRVIWKQGAVIVQYLLSPERRKRCTALTAGLYTRIGRTTCRRRVAWTRPLDFSGGTSRTASRRLISSIRFPSGSHNNACHLSESCIKTSLIHMSVKHAKTITAMPIHVQAWLIGRQRPMPDGSPIC